MRSVKKFESGVVKDTITVTPNTTVREVQIVPVPITFPAPVVDGQRSLLVYYRS